MNSMKYLNIKDGNFVYFNNVIGPKIDCQLTIAGKRFLKWGPMGLEGEQVCLNESQIPQGWTLAYDLDLAVGSDVYRLTISHGVIVKGFKPYLSELALRQETLKTVVTRLTVVTNNRFSFPTFEVADQGSIF